MKSGSAEKLNEIKTLEEWMGRERGKTGWEIKFI